MDGCRPRSSPGIGTPVARNWWTTDPTVAPDAPGPRCARGTHDAGPGLAAQTAGQARAAAPAGGRAAPAGPPARRADGAAAGAGAFAAAGAGTARAAILTPVRDRGTAPGPSEGC